MIIKKISFILILFCITSTLQGLTLTKEQIIEAKKSLKIANEFYKNKQFENALKIYKEFLKQGIKTKEIYYNIGCVYFNLKNYPKARYYFEKALLLDYNNKKIRENLDLTIQKLELDKNLLEQDTFKSLKKIIYLFSKKFWHFINIIVLIIFTIILFLFLIKPIIITRNFIIINVILIIILVISIVNLKIRTYLENQDIIVIEKEGAIIRSAPNEEFDVVFRSRAGQKAYIKSREGKWLELQFENNLHGWYKYEKLP